MIHRSSKPPLPLVLVIDDDPVVGRAIVRALRGVAKVVVELAPEAALDRIRRGERFSMIVSDVMMPGVTGPVLFDRVVAVAPEQRDAWVFASGGMSDLLRELLAATGRPFLEKPLTRDVLLAQLAAIQGRKPA